MHRHIDLTRHQRAFDFSGEQTFATSARIERLGRAPIPASGDKLCGDLHPRDRSPERHSDQPGLGARQLAATRTENDFFRTAHAHAAPYDSGARARTFSEGAALSLPPKRAAKSAT